MYQQNKTKKHGDEETPIHLNGMPFYSQMGVISANGENISSGQWKKRTRDTRLSSLYENSIGLDLLVKLCEDQESLIQKQFTQIEELQDQLEDYEQELYDIFRKRPNLGHSHYREGMI